MVLRKTNFIKLTQAVDIGYKVTFVENIFANHTKNPLLNLCKQKRVLVVIDKNVFKNYGSLIVKFFRENNIDYMLHKFTATEKNKSFNEVVRVCRLARTFGMKRNSYFVGIGGGITTDLVGFAASMYRRKIPYIRIPTTLVGLVDAGVGVKVGVNLNFSKNLLGAYHPPYAVFNDQTFLKTLSAREMRCGLFEIIKMGIINSPYLFTLVEAHFRDYFNKNFNSYTNQINRLSALLMIGELEQNLLETNLRRLVDFGHTFSPFIETSTDYAIPHGEAVGIDILLSTLIAQKRKVLHEHDFDRIWNLISSVGFSNPYYFDDVDGLYASLEDIRKHRADNLNLVLPVKIGVGIFSNKCSFDELQYAANFLKSNCLIS